MYIVHNSTICEINLFDLGVDAVENVFIFTCCMKIGKYYFSLLLLSFRTKC